MSDFPSHFCPEHHVPLVSSRTKYGTRWDCPHGECTVMCWSGETSTPANAETRQARIRAHAAFDRLWKKPTQIMAKAQAYRWLKRITGLKPERAHIGMMDKVQCEFVVKADLAAAKGDVNG